MNKMMLVPFSMQRSQQTPLMTQISSLDDEMQKILKDLSLTPDVKFKLYNQVLHKYSTLMQEQNKPIQVEIKETKPAVTKNEYVLEKVKKNLPKGKLDAGTRLANFLTNSNSISWNDKNELVIDGTLIPHSNIESILNYASRDVRRDPPRGWDTFLRWLADENVPKSAIGNRKGRQQIDDIISPVPLMPSLSDETPKRWESLY